MLSDYTIHLDCTVKEAIEQITKNSIKAVAIVDNNNILHGLFTDGDMRRFFLSGGSLNANIQEAMNPNPTVYSGIDEIEAERNKVIRIIYPIVDKDRHLIDMVDYNRVTQSGQITSLLNVPLVIMAGGKGTRLYPYTKILPKPLIPIGDITITERIIDSFRRYGCKKVFMILNHKANMIKAYMNEISKDYSLDFVEEEQFLGTCGGLYLLKETINDTFYLSNCDILLKADLECAYLTHKSNNNVITFICAMKDFIIPYGVVETDQNGNIVAMREKPDFSFLINTGVYIIEPKVFDYITPGEYLSLPDLALRLINKGEKVGVFPISEKAWMDMGQFSEMDSMMRNLGINQNV